ncbi:FAD:protein FMN transferase [Desulfobacterales bacterium HSG16]|nr:FAD:protein FMN transferase [Desulfobacterales bacterium HSG16]
MGTTYHITIIASFYELTGHLNTKIAKRLDQIEQSMSTFRKNSEISRFNNLKQLGKPFEISKDFMEVMSKSQYLYKITDGAWDGTIHPLLDLWGFYDYTKIHHVPDDEQIKQVLTKIGFNHIEIKKSKTAGGCLEKKHTEISVDLASIAKGYGVDKIAELIHQNGFDNFLVEIGGEIYARGLRKDGKHWVVGVNTPKKGAGSTEVYKALPLTDRAMATSGDYRNYFKKNGKFYSHIIDPKTGYSVQNNVVSASVIAKTCTIADGLATAFMVMGPEKSIELAESLDGVECLVIVRDSDDTLTDHYSSGFETF